MKRALLGMMAALGLSSCATDVAGTIGTGNTAGVAGVNMTGSGSEVGAKVYLYEAGNLSTPVDSTITDAQGKFEFHALPVGAYKLFLDQDGLAGAFQDVVIKENETTNSSVQLRPYVVMTVDTLLNGYCGVGANRLVNVGSSTLVRIPQQSGSLQLMSGSSTVLSVAWDSLAGTTSLSRAGKVVQQEAIAKHDGLLLATPASKVFDAGELLAWLPQAGDRLRVSVVFTLTENTGDTANLISFGNAFALQMSDSVLQFSFGSASSAIPQGVVAKGKPQMFVVLLDGSTNEFTSHLSALGGYDAVEQPERMVPGLSNATGRLVIGSASSRVKIHGVSVDLVKPVLLATPRVESDN